jgi:hypothetical protein
MNLLVSDAAPCVIRLDPRLSVPLGLLVGWSVVLRLLLLRGPLGPILRAPGIVARTSWSCGLPPVGTDELPCPLLPAAATTAVRNDAVHDS